MRGLAATFALAVAAGAVSAQEMLRTYEEGGHVFTYRQRELPAGAQLIDPAATLQPDSPLSTSKLLGRHLAAGNIEEAALLSNEPKRRFQVLSDYRESVGEAEFKRVFSQYYLPENRLLAEVTIGPHSLLVWHLTGQKHYAGQYYVRVEDRWLIDDVPNETRANLRKVLLSFRSERK